MVLILGRNLGNTHHTELTLTDKLREMKKKEKQDLSSLKTEIIDVSW